MKKIFAIILSFAILLLIFLLTDKKTENLQEEILWKENPTKISLVPSKNEKEFKNNFIREEIDFERYTNFFKDSALFTISATDKESNQKTIYECGYHCKNLFTELSVLKILSAAFSETSSRKNLQIDADSSPKLNLYQKNKAIKEMLIGKESPDNRRRFFEADGKIYSAHSYIFNRFKEPIYNFRERQIFSIGNSKIKYVEFVSEDKTVKVSLTPIIKNGIEKNSYTRLSQKKILIDKVLGESLELNLKSLKVELFPDEKNGEGFLVANELTKGKENYTLKITLSNALQFTLKIFPTTNIKDIKYRPVLRQLQDIKESPAYIKEENFQKIIEDFTKIHSTDSAKKSENQKSNNPKPENKK